MNLQPLYTVKERLEQAAIAGTGLLSEDFRLQRAAEGLKPLAAASPVFAKIDGGLQKLLAAAPEERSGLLLDLLALVDAVVYTQGKTGIDGDLEPLPTGNGVCLELSYAQLSPLLEALTGTGGGRMNQIKAIGEDHPEFFGDYRVLPVLVDHLGESYVELANLLFNIAREQGPAVIPLLKKGFDPAGKREMARRVQLMDTLAGAGENNWYLEHLPASKNLVRESLIFALRHDSANAAKLEELCQTEKKDCQDAAFWALSRLESDQALEYWRALAQKDAEKVLHYMRHAASRTASIITAELARETLRPLCQDPDQPLDGALWKRLEGLRFALEFKTGPEILEVYRLAASLGTSLDREVTVERDGKRTVESMLFWCYGATNQVDSKRYFSTSIPFILMHSIQCTRDPGLCALAEELYEKYGGPWASPALCAALLTQDSEIAFQKADEALNPQRKLFTGSKQVSTKGTLRDLTWSLFWNKDTNHYEYLIYFTDPATVNRSPRTPLQRPTLAQDLDPRWFDLLMQAGSLDMALFNLIHPIDHPVMEKLGKYFHFKATHGVKSYVDLRNYIGVLKQCGWKQWEDFLPQCAPHMEALYLYQVTDLIGSLPVSGGEKAAQLQAVTELVWSGKVKVKGGRWPDLQVRQAIDAWAKE